MEQVQQQQGQLKKEGKKKVKSQRLQLKPQMIRNLIRTAGQITTRGFQNFGTGKNKGDNKMIQELKRMIQGQIKPLSYKQIGQLKVFLKDALEGRKISQKKQQTQKVQSRPQNQLADDNPLVEEYLILLTIMRQQSVPAHIIDAFFDIYMDLWNNDPNISRKRLLQLWKQIPYRNLSTYLAIFKLEKDFQAIGSQKITKEMLSNLTDNKLQQCCQYYKLYTVNNQNLSNKNQYENLRQFQDDHLLPKLVKSDQALSLHVLALLKQKQSLKKKLLSQIDPSVGLRVIEGLNEDARQYDNVHQHILKQHFRSFLSQYKDKWYVLEDKISFSQRFLQQYAKELIDNTKDRFQDFVTDQTVPGVFIAQSILFRANLLSLQKVQRLVQNPLFKYDHFGNVQTILYRKTYNEKNPLDYPHHVRNLYLHLQDYGIDQKSIIIIDSVEGEEFVRLKQEIALVEKQGGLVGFDTEFRNIETKFQQQGCSLIQLCINKVGFIIDFIKIQKEPKFTNFMVEFLTNPKIHKVGHTIDADMKQLALTFTIPGNKQCQGFIDVIKIFKAKHPGSKYTSLSYMCQVLTGKKMSKFQQRSNWIRRPLKKTQVHYAVMDAFACLLCLQKMEGDKAQGLQYFQEMQIIDKKSSQFEEVIREPNFVYGMNYKHYICKNKTKFLCDNMLKKLCSIMRNIGIDTEYIAVKNYDLAVQIAQNEERVILTKDTKFFGRKEQSVPLYLVQANGDNEDMFEEIVKKFNLKLKKFQSLSRCVKCNCADLQQISKEQACQVLQFKHQESQIKVFWRCSKCKQIYWQGNQFLKAKNQYDLMRKKK